MHSRLTRRTFLAVPAALAAPAFARAAGQVFDTDVVVIGAGAAGLAAAHEVRRMRRRAIVLEARNRVGGRIFTDTSLGAPFDGGAFYLHWAERNPWTRIARGYRIVTLDESQLPRFSQSFDKGDPPASQEGLAQWSALRDKLDDSKADIPDISLLQFAGGKDAPAAEGALAMSRLALGEEAERVSARDYSKLIAGDDRIVPDGFGTILERYARGLDIRLDTPVQAIDWGGQGVRVTTAQGTIRARACVVTVSVGVLKSEAIRIAPALPRRTLRGFEGLAMGASTRMALRFDGERFGLRSGTNVRLRLSPRESFSFGCFAHDREMVSVYFGGDHAREVIAMGEKDATQLALEQFASVIGSRAKSHYRGGKLYGWWADPFARGGYSHALPGYFRAREDLAAPIAGKLFFAGEATGGSGGASGAAITAGGAYLAGVAAARRAARAG